MILALTLVFVLGIAVAYANGANDVSKGIATLVGSGVTNYRRAVAWGTLWTGVGGIAGAFLAHAMVQTFGKGLLSPSVHATVAAALATIAGAALWVAIATRKGLPVSTTHAIVGSIAGVATAAYGFAGVNWTAAGSKIALPLALSPVVSLALTSIVLRTWKALAPQAEGDCICVEVLQPTAAWANGAGSIPLAAVPQVHLATCVASRTASRGVNLNHLHWLTSGATSFSRGLNDAPKMVALVLAAALLSGKSFNSPTAYFIAITAGMLAGSWFAGLRVTDVLANRVTPMNHREGVIANLITAALVGPGAALGLPMSTTHVSSGAIMGIAAGHGEGANKQTIRDVLLAWVVTLPAAAILGVTVFFVLRLAGLR
ncbi:MAG: inorganic phosphate transporter [Acidobacteriales bacterium]|nr:inorganic phosphate transporter [Terriglobales bacterium]